MTEDDIEPCAKRCTLLIGLKDVADRSKKLAGYKGGRFVVTKPICGFLFPLIVAAVSACSSTGTATSNCTSRQPYQGPPKRSVPDFAWERDFSRSIDGKLDPDLTRRLNGSLDSLLAHYPAVSAAVALPDHGTWVATRGFVRAGTPATVDDASLFQIGSVGKAFTAAVVLQLIEEGQLSLDNPVDRWFPEVPNADLLTIADLLTHTSGLVSFNALPDKRKLSATYHPPDELVRIASSYDPYFCPGAAWSYTNTGYVMLGKIVEAIEGRPFHEVLATRVLVPLELNHTILRQPGDGVAAVVDGHESGKPIGAADDDYATPYTAGAFASTASDLVRFWHALLSGKVVSTSTMRASFEQMYPMQPLFPSPPGTETFYGRGVQLTDAPGGDDGPGLMLEHSGGIFGFNAVVAYVVEDDAYVAVAVNDKNVPAMAGLWRLLQDVRAFHDAPGPLTESRSID